VAGIWSVCGQWKTDRKWLSARKGKDVHMLEKSLEEIAVTEGGLAAERVRKRNKLVRVAMLLSIVIYFICFECISVGDSVSFYFLKCLVLVLAYLVFLKYIRKYLSRIHDILEVECDPYKMEEALAYFYIKNGIAGKESRKRMYNILMARAIILQGDFDRAYDVLMGVDRDCLRKGYWFCTYHDCMRMYYCSKDDVQVLSDMKKYFFQLSKDYSMRKRHRKFMEKEIQIINIHLSMMKGELGDYEIASQKADWKKGANITLVSHRWMDARAHYIKNEAEAAKADCRYVIENGNRLYYTNLAREMVQLISGAGSSPAPPPAENISPAPAGKVRP